MAKSVPYVVRNASAMTLPISDSQVRPVSMPQASARGIGCTADPMTRPSVGARSTANCSSVAAISGSGVTPMFQGRWWSAVR